MIFFVIAIKTILFCLIKLEELEASSFSFFILQLQYFESKAFMTIQLKKNSSPIVVSQEEGLLCVSSVRIRIRCS